jgi:hypothetical protein
MLKRIKTSKNLYKKSRPHYEFLKTRLNHAKNLQDENLEISV